MYCYHLKFLYFKTIKGMLLKVNINSYLSDLFDLNMSIFFIFYVMN